MNETSTVQDRHLTPDRLGPPSFSEAFRFWLKLGFVSFGGPSGQIAMMHTELVEKKRWIDNARFLHALNFCMLLPGPEAQQLAIYIGWLLHKTRGGIVAGALFVIPSIFILWALSYVYVAFGNIPWIAAIFYGLKPAVLAIVAAAVIRIGSKALKNAVMWSLALAAFVAIYFFRVPFPLIIISAGFLGLVGSRILPQYFRGKIAHPLDVDLASKTGDRAKPMWLRALKVSTTWIVIWAGAAARPCRNFSRNAAHHFSRRNLFQQSRRRHFRRRLCGAPLCLAASGRALSLADRAPNVGWARSGRDHAGSFDHGFAVRRFSRRVESSGKSTAARKRNTRCPGHDLDHFCPLFSLGFFRRTLHREIARREITDRCTINCHRRGRRCNPEPRGLVWTPRHFSWERKGRLVCARPLRRGVYRNAPL